jgi:hypothetical protein
MGNVGPVTWFQNTAKQACPYCDAVFRHEAWCFATNPNVRYAFEAAWGQSLLTAGDVLILHSLGAIW